MLLERLLVHRLLPLDPLYNFLLTFGLTLLLVRTWSSVEVRRAAASPYDAAPG